MKYYQSSDIFVFPSLSEGSSLACLEAMSCGLPCIVTENSGSIITNNKEGVVIPIRSVKSIKENILYFYNNLDEVKRMGKNARTLAEKHDWKFYEKRLLQMYKNIMS